MQEHASLMQLTGISCTQMPSAENFWLQGQRQDAFEVGALWKQSSSENIITAL